MKVTIITHNQRAGCLIPKEHSISYAEMSTIKHPFLMHDINDTATVQDLAEETMYKNGHSAWRIPELCNDKTIFEA